MCVMLKSDVLDPQGKAIQKAAVNMGVKNILEVNQGKYFKIIIKNASSSKHAKEIAIDLSKKLLVNQVIETFVIVSTKKV